MRALQESESSWPEDEARATVRAYLGDLEDGIPETEAQETLGRQNERCRVYLEKEAGKEASARYDHEVSKLLDKPLH